MTVLLMKMNLRYEHPSPPLGNELTNISSCSNMEIFISAATLTLACVQGNVFCIVEFYIKTSKLDDNHSVND